MSSPITTKAQKVDWLVEHQEAWEGYPIRKTDLQVFNSMKAAGIISDRVSNYGAMDLGSLIGLARDRLRHQRNKGLS